MDHDRLLKFIQESGVKTKSEVFEKFQTENPEIVSMSIDYLASKNLIRRVKFDPHGGTSELYYIPQGSNY